MLTHIHPTAVVDPAAEIADDAVIGPYCTVGPGVRLHEQVVLGPHVNLVARTELMPRVRVFPGAVLGGPPQHVRHADDPGRLVIGEDTVIREHVTAHTGTGIEELETRIGARCLLMVASHVGHDCRIGDDVILTNNATLGGHVRVGDRAILGGVSAVHQFVRIGEGAMIGGMTGVEDDVMPYGIVMGDRARLRGLNLIGLKRAGADRGEIKDLRRLYQKIFFGRGEFADRVRSARRMADTPRARAIVEFLETPGKRSFCLPEGYREGGRDYDDHE